VQGKQLGGGGWGGKQDDRKKAWALCQYYFPHIQSTCQIKSHGNTKIKNFHRETVLEYSLKINKPVRTISENRQSPEQRTNFIAPITCTIHKLFDSSILYCIGWKNFFFNIIFIFVLIPSPLYSVKKCSSGRSKNIFQNSFNMLTKECNFDDDFKLLQKYCQKKLLKEE
jgi:hypothetical protein